MNKLSKKQQGFTLIEVLVSVLVFSVGMLGLGGLQITSTKVSNNAHFRTTASLLAMDLADRMRANLAGVSEGYYAEAINCSTASIPVCRNSGSDCSVEDLAKYDIFEIKCGTKIGETSRDGGVQNLLIGGNINVSCDGGCNAPKAVHDIVITWNDIKTDDRPESSEEKTLAVSVIP